MEDTAVLLRQVLDGDDEAADLLAEVLHSVVSLEDIPVSAVPSDEPLVNLDELALWIDPIGKSIPKTL